jgi:hypothetical protein
LPSLANVTQAFPQTVWPDWQAVQAPPEQIVLATHCAWLVQLV